MAKVTATTQEVIRQTHDPEDISRTSPAQIRTNHWHKTDQHQQPASMEQQVTHASGADAIPPFTF
jgi:hypothetical protein